MNTLNLIIIALSLGNLILLARTIRLKQERVKHRTLIKRLKRTVEKLDTRNGKLWYEVARNKEERIDSPHEGTAFTVTHQ